MARGFWTWRRCSDNIGARYPPLKLHFQFAPSVSEAVRAELIQRLKQQGARVVRPLFPGENDPELAAIQVVESDDVTGEKLLQQLKSFRTVQYAEVAPKRKLIR